MHCWWECKLVQPLWKTVWRVLKKPKIELPYDPGIPLLAIYPKKTKTLSRKNTCTSMFTAALFTIAKLWKQPKRPSTDEWIKMWGVCVCVRARVCVCMYVCVGILFSHKKEGNFALCSNMDGLGGHYAK